MKNDPHQLELTARPEPPALPATAKTYVVETRATETRASIQKQSPSTETTIEYTDEVEPQAAKKTFTVSEIVRLASSTLETRFGTIAIEGEVSNLRTPSSGHLYFTLKDSAAQLSVVMFRSVVGKLPFRVEDGQLLICRGKLAIYDAQGRFQLTATGAEPSGIGALQLAFEQLKKKLDAEGLFDQKHKKPLPFFPRKIAVVTSPTGAAVRDVIRVLERRCPVHVIVCPAAVQGDAAPGEIAQAIAAADQLGVDVIIVGRGGGSLEDLWAFNTEDVARAIFAAQTPIISAVGHEIDVTIADGVADLRAATPSNAAEIVIPMMIELRQNLQTVQTRLSRATLERVRVLRHRFERLTHRLGTPEMLVQRIRMRLDDLSLASQNALRKKIKLYRERLVTTQLRLARRQPQLRIAAQKSQWQKLCQRLTTQMHDRLLRDRARLSQLAATLDALSPLAVLGRGFSVVTNGQNQIIRDTKALKVGDEIQIRFHQGQVSGEITRIG